MIPTLDSATRERLDGCRVVAAVSGGKDSAAMSLWLTENGIEHDRTFADTNWEHGETYRYLRGPLVEKLGPITEVRSPVEEPCPCMFSPCALCGGSGRTWGMVALILKKGMFPSRVRRFCTQELKVFPLQRAIKMVAERTGLAVINSVGIRAEESDKRAEMPEWEWQDGFDCDVWRPLLRWSLEDVVAIHARHGLAPNPLYLQGATRVGCWPCIYARKAEIRLVADNDPARVELIRQLEAVVSARAAERGDPRYRSFFGLWQHGRGTRACSPIGDVVAWSRTGKGGTTPDPFPLFFGAEQARDGCLRWGLCGVEDGGWPTPGGGAA